MLRPRRFQAAAGGAGFARVEEHVVVWVSAHLRLVVRGGDVVGSVGCAEVGEEVGLREQEGDGEFVGEGEVGPCVCEEEEGAAC